MAFSDDSVRAKLSALSETQDSIVSVAQWIMFYRRHADRTAQLWFEKLKDSNTSKKLNLLYLANEIMQQAKSRRKEDFLVAFMPIIAEATAVSYKGATQEVQNKIRRVVEVWRQRQVLEKGIQDATEARIDELDKNRSSRTTTARLGGSLFGSSSVPTELQPLTQAHAALTKAETTLKPVLDKANTDYVEHNKPDAPVPSAPVQAGRLSSLMKTLATAEAAVNDSIKARTQLLEGLEALLASHRAKLNDEESSRTELTERRATTEAKRKEVEDIIFRRVSAEDEAAREPAPTTGSGDEAPEHSPDVESFTPPPPEVEQFSAPNSPVPVPEQDIALDNGAAPDIPAPAPAVQEAVPPPPVIGADLLRSLSVPGSRPRPAEGGPDPRKRRKMSHMEPDLEAQMLGAGAGIGLDDDVAADLGA